MLIKMTEASAVARVDSDIYDLVTVHYDVVKIVKRQQRINKLI